MASDIKIVYHNNVFAGSGAPADGDLLTRDNSSHPKDSVYIDRDSGTVYVRKDTTLVADTDWQASTGGGTGGATITDVTYAELAALIGSSVLTTGAQYRITDYTTVHYIVDAGGTQYLDSIITGVNEPLVVTANSTNTIDKEAKSALHPEDVIHYDWNPDNWLTDVSFSALPATEFENPTIITGFKGVIYFRHDTLQDNYMGYDFRNVKFRRWNVDAPTWDSGTTYAKGNFVKEAGYIFKSLKNSNTNNLPGEGSIYWVKCLDLTYNEYWNNRPSSTNSIPSNAADYIDVFTFSESGAFTYKKYVNTNHFIANIKSVNISYQTILLNNVFFLNQDGSLYGMLSNTVESACMNNTVCGAFYGNVVGSNMMDNQMALVFDNFLGNYFISNICLSLLDSSFVSYTYGNIFTYSEKLMVGGSFNYNVLATTFSCNDIASKVEFFTLTQPVNYAVFQPRISGSGANFDSATHIYASYNVTVFNDVNGALKLSYIDGTGNITVVNANA